MCEACTEHGLEQRCVRCRPRRTAEERRERRANAARRSPQVRCDGCGYQGPRFDLLVPMTWREGVLIGLSPLMMGVGALFGLAMALSPTTEARCPACESTLLWPHQGGPLQHPAWDAAHTAQRARWFRLRAPAVGLGLLALFVGAAVVLSSFWALLTDLGSPHNE